MCPLWWKARRQTRQALCGGYVITAINGEEIESMLELKEELTYYAAGDTVELSIMKMMSQGYGDGHGQCDTGKTKHHTIKAKVLPFGSTFCF